MPFDSFGSSLEKDILELEKYQEAVQYVVDTGFTIPNSKLETLAKLAKDLQRQKERKEHELKVHRQRVQESGVKF